MMSTVMPLLPLMMLLADPSGAGWEQAGRGDGVFVYARSRAGSDVREMKATGMVNASPQKVWAVLRDYENYKNHMPYTTESKVVAKEEGDRIVHFYSVVDAPLVDARDYVIRIVDQSTYKDGNGYFLTTWTRSNKGPPEKPGMVRVRVAEGFWKVEPRDGGKTSFVTYYVYTDPGGSVPKWLVNKANSIAVPDLFKALRKRAGAEE